MFKVAKGEVFINEIEKRNSIAITDNPDKEEIKFYFQMYKKADKLIYVSGKEQIEYLRKDYEEVKE